MKKLIIAINLVLLATASAFAEGQVDSTRYLASKLSQNWFISAGFGVNAWQGSDRNPAGDYTKLNGPTYGINLAAGKWITHNIALRLSYDINQAHSFIQGRHIRLTGINFLYGDSPTADANDYYKTSFMYHNLHGDVLISPVDLYMGYYNPNRTYTPYLFAGMGLACVSAHPLVIQSLIAKESRNFEFSFATGLVNSFKISKAFDLDLSFFWSIQEWHIDSWYYEYQGGDGLGKRPRIFDSNYTASLGLTWNLLRGRIYELPYNYEREMREMRERIKELEDQLDDDKPVSAGTPMVVHDTVFQTVNVETPGEYVSYPFSIFFNLDSYQLMSRRDLINLREIAKVALEKNWKIRLRGSCDSATATPEYNQRLSENRCRKIQMELMDMGVPEDQIILVPVGGVHELDPTEFDRRVFVELIKEVK